MLVVGDGDTCLKKEFQMFRFDFTQKCFVLVTRQGERFVKKKRNLMKALDFQDSCKGDSGGPLMVRQRDGRQVKVDKIKSGLWYIWYIWYISGTYIWQVRMHQSRLHDKTSLMRKYPPDGASDTL